MAARKLRLTIVASLCGLVCVFVAGLIPAVAGAAQFGTEGEEAGQLEGVIGLGLDQETGDVYLGEYNNARVSKFDGSGDFLFAWGTKVNLESPADESQICTVATGCKQGETGTGAGEFSGGCGPQGVAIDNDPLSDSYKDVYVVDFCNYRVQKFDQSGKFLLMFGGHVNETKDGAAGATEAEKDVCVAGETCTMGSEGTGDGEFAGAFERSYIAVGPGGAVYVGDKARIQVFEPSGVWKENVSLAKLSSTGKVETLAVNSAGDMFVADEGVSGVREFEPGGTEKATQFDTGSTAIEAITVNAAGDLFIADSTGGFHVLEYDPAGNPLASFGSGITPPALSIAFSEALDELYVSMRSRGDVEALTLPPPGPLVEPESESVNVGQHGTAMLEAKVNPEASETTSHFEYVDQADFQASGYASASSTVSRSAGSSIQDQAADATLTALAPGIYHYRVVATNAKGVATGPDETFTTAPIEGPWATNVAGTSATLSARINPLGSSAEYRLEYGTSLSYGNVLTGSLGEGSSYILVTHHLQELQPGTEYHYRIVLVNQFGTYEGLDRTFTTQAVASQVLTLPDGRAWELVSPANKKGALIEPFEESQQIQAAADGSGITYLSVGPHLGENPHGKTVWSQVLSRRGTSGWSSEDLSLPRTLPENGESVEELLTGFPEYRLFSPDLSLAAVEPQYVGTPLLSLEATTRTLYLRNDSNGSFQPLVTPANVPPGTTIEEKSGQDLELWDLRFLTATPDLSHILFKTPEALTSDAIAEYTAEDAPVGQPRWNLYEWGAGKLQLVNILPNGEATHGPNSPQVTLAGEVADGEGDAQGSVQRVVSNDGHRVAWTWGEPYGNERRNTKGLYVRDMVEEKTVKIGGHAAVYETMSSDGSKIFYEENGDLYLYDYDTHTETDLTADHGANEASAGLQPIVSDVSEDGSYVYFVATGVLASGGVSGMDNLYLLHDTGSEWQTTHIATLSPEDRPDWFSEAYVGSPALERMSSRVSPDGRYLAFMSNRSLTGYDNLDAVSGQPDEEVYLYDSVTGHVVCASCNPTGARPVGVLDPGGLGVLLVDRQSSWGSGRSGTEHWLAGSIPGWDTASSGATYQPRYLSDSGRLFFDSPDALVPQDTNGLEDVYEYEPPGVGSCQTTEATYSERSGGCVNLISSGTSNGESDFYDASESGDDVFFITSSRLSPADYDTNLDVYDAHVCSSSLPCASEPVSPPPCSSGDSCKAAPSPQPEIFGPAPSATFSGIGNVMPSAASVAPKSLTRAQQLARVLKACRKKAHKKRLVCERQAHKRYPAAQSHTLKTTKKGHR